jgi:hypothetical protein
MIIPPSKNALGGMKNKNWAQLFQPAKTAFFFGKPK